MKCLIDTNILVSAALWPNGVSAHAFMKAVTTPDAKNRFRSQMSP
jgi:predicted nucleic acid-binding protein